MQSVSDLTDGKEVIASGMRKEVDRCRMALERAGGGAVVSLLSSGDAGVYGMAGLILEIAARLPLRPPIEIVPGISAANSAAARLGAPLMLDYACISLSDLLMPGEVIRRRLEAVAVADMTVALYNAKSRQRTKLIEEAAAIFLRHRPVTTPVGVATAVSNEEEERVELSDLAHFLDVEMDMRSIVIIGNSSSLNLNGLFVTPRGYRL